MVRRLFELSVYLELGVMFTLVKEKGRKASMNFIFKTSHELLSGRCEYWGRLFLSCLTNKSICRLSLRSCGKQNKFFCPGGS